MSWQISLIFNLIFGTIRSYLDKKLVEKIDPFVVYIYTVIWMTGYLIIYSLFFKHSIPSVYPEMIAMGVLYGVAIASYLKAIKINLSQSVVFTSYYLVIPMVLSAVFLGEYAHFNLQNLSGQKTISGLTLAFISMFLILRSHTRREAKMELTWVFLIITNIVLNGIGTFWGKTFVDKHTLFDTMFSQCLGGIPTVFFISLIGKSKYSLTMRNHLWLALDGLIITLAVVFYYQTVKSGPLTLILPIQTLLGTVAITLVGLVIYKEAQKLEITKIFGLGLGILGVVLLMI